MRGKNNDLELLCFIWFIKLLIYVYISDATIVMTITVYAVRILHLKSPAGGVQKELKY